MGKVSKKSDSKKAAKEAKQAKQTLKSAKKALKKGDDVPVEAIVATLTAKQISHPPGKFIASKAPAARSSCTMVAYKNQGFLLFGGEYYNGKDGAVYGDLMRWNPCKGKKQSNQDVSMSQTGVEDEHDIARKLEMGRNIDKDCDRAQESDMMVGSTMLGGNRMVDLEDESGEWKVFDGSCIIERCGQAGLIFQDSFYVFGGEFFRKNSKFYHFSDFWKFSLKTLQWTQIETASGKGSKGPAIRSGPMGRSGHRMALCRNVIVLFGGFRDCGKFDQYFDDTWIFLPQQDVWKSIDDARQHQSSDHEAQVIDLRPSPRSGFICGSTNDGVYIHGGYCKTKATQGSILKDSWWLNMRPYFENPARGLPVWERLPKAKGQPTPRRTGTAFCQNKNSIIVFGGVVDEDDGGLVYKQTVWFNDLLSYDLHSNRWNNLTGIVFNHQAEYDDHGNLQEDPRENTVPREDEDSGIDEERSHLAGSPAFAGDTPTACKSENVHETMDDKGAIAGSRAVQGIAGGTKAAEGGQRQTTFCHAGWLTKGKSRLVRCILQSGKAISEAVETDIMYRVNQDPALTTEPLPRMGASIAVSENYVYLFGGTLEIGRRNVVLDDCWRYNLNRKGPWQNLHSGTFWQGLEDDDESDYDDSTSTSSELSEQSDGSSDDIASDEEEEAKFKAAQTEIEKVLGLEDPLPILGEKLKDYFLRSKAHWQQKVAAAAVDDTDQQTAEFWRSRKELSDRAFKLAATKHKAAESIAERFF